MKRREFFGYSQCPVFSEKNMKNSYYSTRKSEMEQELAK
jgi:hypothetical protein